MNVNEHGLQVLEVAQVKAAESHHPRLRQLNTLKPLLHFVPLCDCLLIVDVCEYYLLAFLAQQSQTASYSTTQQSTTSLSQFVS